MLTNQYKKHPVNCLSFLQSIILSFILSFISISTTFAVEPTIYTFSNNDQSYSLALRGDGVLFQFGGQSFEPVQLDGNAATPIQPNAVILDNVESIIGEQDNPEIFAITSTGNVFTWQPSNTQELNKANPVQVEGLSDVKNIFIGGVFNLALTNTGTVFSFGGYGDYPVTQIPELNNAKIYYSKSDSVTQMTALINNAKIYSYEVFFAITNTGNGFSIYEYYDEIKGGSEIKIIPIMDESNQNLSNITSITRGGGGSIKITPIMGGGSKIKIIPIMRLALTSSGEVYRFDWDSNDYGLAVLIKDEFGATISNANQIFANGMNPLILTETGEIYMSPTDDLANFTKLTIPEKITKVYCFPTEDCSGMYFGLSENQTIYYWNDDYGNTSINFNHSIVSGFNQFTEITSSNNSFPFAVTATDEFYSLQYGWDEINQTYTIFSTRIDGVSNVNKVRNYQGMEADLPSGIILVLTNNGELYTWSWYLANNQYLTYTPAVQVSDWNDVISIGDNSDWNNVISIDDNGVGYKLILRADGTLCGVGDNSDSQLGIDPNTTPYVPIDNPVCGIEDLIVTTDAAQYTLTIDKTGNGTVIDGNLLDCGTTCNNDYLNGNQVNLLAVPDSGFTFDSWTGDCSDTIDSITVTMDSAKTCTANFTTAPNRTLTMILDGTGTGTVTATTGVDDGLNCGTDCTEDYLNNSEVVLTTTPDTGSKFVKWTDCISDFTITSNKSCTATFDLLPIYTLNVGANNSGSITSTGIDCGNDCTEDYYIDTNITLTATPNDGYSFSGWSGDCSSSSSRTTITIEKNMSCYANFQLNVSYPNMHVYPTELEFTASENNSSNRTITVSNTGKGGLYIQDITIDNTDSFAVVEENCSKQWISTDGSCELTVQFTSESDLLQTTILSINSNDSDNPVFEINLQGSSCANNNARRYVDFYPRKLDFGIEATGGKVALVQNVHTWIQGCGSLDLKEIEFIGDNADEFSLKNLNCYYGGWEDSTYSSCQFTVVFKPTSEGVKDAKLQWQFNDPSINYYPIPMIAEAVSDGQAGINITPNSHDFGNIVLGRGSYQYQPFTVENTGNINLQIDSISLTGTDANEFKAYDWDCKYRGILQPNETCEINAQFQPTLSAGPKQSDLIVYSNADDNNIALSGTVSEPADCATDNVTISSNNNGHWDATTSWDLARIPNENDVVAINHIITGLDFAKVKALCVSPDGKLESQDSQGTPLEIQATDYIENKGEIIGKDGADSKLGASVVLKVATSINKYDKAGDQWWYSYSSGGPILNTGIIAAGNGGNSDIQAGNGGDAIVLGRNTTNKGTIQAGNGGSLLSDEKGIAGKGGIAQIWGKLGGSGNLYNQNGAIVRAGDGGQCNSDSQTGGAGGNLWLVSLPNVYLNGGIHKAGKAGCSNSADGWVRIEPSVIDLSGGKTVVDGGDIAIYGGNDWTLNLSNLSGTVVTATGDITLAVGENGIIDFTGSSKTILRADGQVYIFADNILLDEDVILSDLIQAEKIVFGPSKTLRYVSLTGSGTFIGQVGATIPIALTLANNGIESDTYDIQINSAWNVQSANKVSVSGLSTQSLILDVTLPTELGTDTIVITATSQADSKVQTSMQIEIVAQMEGVIASYDDIASDDATTPEMTGDSHLENSAGSVIDATNNDSDSYNSEATVNDNSEPNSDTNNSAVHSHASTTGQLIINNGCSSNDTINRVCSNNWQVLTDVILGENASISGGELAGNIDNQGLISQVSIQSGTIVTGGKFSGYIKNAGTIADFEFVGASLIGGTLAGTVHNNSTIGEIQDVQLAAYAKIINGTIAGNIQGDCTNPARLQNVVIAANSNLSCVIIEPNSIVGDNVTFGNGVQVLPTLIALNNLAVINITEIPDAKFAGGITKNGGSFGINVNANPSDLIDVRGRITVAPEHIDQAIDILIVIASSNGFVMLNSVGEQIAWDGQIDSLIPFLTINELDEPVEIQIYNGYFDGTQNFYFGYRLADGTIVYNSDSLEVN
ncbi:choice-of-anchor D domain-containing protein [Candidatus Halobeggiatoa sp. HSG11]|nr:choice-of-anchor D domain-containing protein [Candidatus Halobeggiatoa sp. HSG11]